MSWEIVPVELEEEFVSFLNKGELTPELYYDIVCWIFRKDFYDKYGESIPPEEDYPQWRKNTITFRDIESLEVLFLKTGVRDDHNLLGRIYPVLVTVDIPWGESRQLANHPQIEALLKFLPIEKGEIIGKLLEVRFHIKRQILVKVELEQKEDPVLTREVSCEIDWKKCSFREDLLGLLLKYCQVRFFIRGV